jgi:hypothetical protein
MDQFKITISIVNYLLYVIIIMLIYGIKIIRKMPIILTGGWVQVEGWRRGSAGEAWSSVCERWHWVKGSEK